MTCKVIKYNEQRQEKNKDRMKKIDLHIQFIRKTSSDTEGHLCIVRKKTQISTDNSKF